MINPRDKGANGEREICDELNFIINIVRQQLGLPRLAIPQVQRNQNQSAVGGCDLTGTYGLAIEIKRQEQLALNTWWTQCVKSAEHLGEHPVLLFRQNAKPGQRTRWRCVTFVDVPLPAAHQTPIKVRAEMEYEDFRAWFREWVTTHIKSENPWTGTHG